MLTKLKLICLQQLLLRWTDEQHTLTAGALVERLAEMGVSAERKSIYRDIETLRKGGLDIVKTGNGYYVGQREFTLPEVSWLRDAVVSAPFIPPKATHEALKKLRGLCSEYQADELENNVRVMNLSKALGDEMFALVNALENAIDQQKRVDLVVTESGWEEPSQNEIELNPYALIWRNDRYYLVGNVEGEDDLRHFELAQITSAIQTEKDARPCSQVSRYPNQFDEDDYARRHLGSFSGLPVRVRMRCANATYHRLNDSFRREMSIEREGNTFIALLDVAPTHEFICYLAQFGSDIEILSPSALRAQMREHLLQSAKLYTIC